MIKLIENAREIKLEFPYQEDMIEKCRNLGGKFLPYRYQIRHGKWFFEKDEDVLNSLKAAIREVFDLDVDTKRKKAYLTAKEDIYRNFTFKGFALSILRHGGSGAAIGSGVTLLTGRVYGVLTVEGNVKSWSSVIEKGSEFEIKDFPVDVESTDDFIIEYAEEEEHARESTDREVALGVAKFIKTRISSNKK